MLRGLPVTILAFGLFTQGTAAANSSASELASRLSQDTDFRVRVLTELELGRRREALESLERALEDAHASARAQLLHAVQSLKEQTTSTLPPDLTPKVIVKLGSLRNATSVKSPTIERTIMLESRRGLEELPGVAVLPSDDEASTESELLGGPVVLVTTSIQKLTTVRDGDEIVYSANVEYLVRTLPDEAIQARFTGSASATASQFETRDREKRAELRREVATAAVRSALKRATNALLAAVR